MGWLYNGACAILQALSDRLAPLASRVLLTQVAHVFKGNLYRTQLVADVLVVTAVGLASPLAQDVCTIRISPMCAKR